MTFQPFGTRVNLYSPLPPDMCRRQLEAKFVRGWDRPFDQRPRGKFFGSLLITWLGAYDWINRGSEAKLILWIAPAGSGTRIHGRAVPGIQIILCLIPAIFMAIWASAALLAYRPDHAPADPITYAIVKIILAVCPLALAAGFWWTAHISRRDGRPLVTFIKRIVSAQDIGPSPAAIENHPCGTGPEQTD